jgi:hypothetical protein
VLSVAAIIALVLVVRLDRTGDDGQVTVGTQPVAPTPDPLEGAADDSWVRLLAHAPRPDGASRPVMIVDLARARTLAGLDPLPPEPSEQQWQDHSAAAFGHPDILNGVLGTSPTPAELRAELGMSHEQFDQAVVAHPEVGLPRYFARGRFDPAAIAAAVQADPQWSPMLEVRQHRGVTYYRWGDDLRLYRKSPVRDLGNGGRLVVGDGWVAWVYTDADAEATIDAWLDPDRSLAADDPIRLAAEHADADGLTEIAILPDAHVATGRAGALQPLADLAPIDRPLAWSLGSTGATIEVRPSYRVTYPTGDQAAANLDAYDRAWRGFATDAVQSVGRSGSSLVATVTFPQVPPDVAPRQVFDGRTWRTAGAFMLFFPTEP